MIVTSTYGKEADLKERSNLFYKKNKQIFDLDYYYYIYNGFKSFVSYFAGRFMKIGIVYFVYYLYPKSQEDNEIKKISLQDFGNQRLSVPIIIAYFIYLYMLAKSIQFLRSDER